MQLWHDWIQQECWLCMYVWLVLIRRRWCELNWILICVYGVAFVIKGDFLAGNDSWVAVLDMLNAIPWFSTSSAQAQWSIFINSRKGMSGSRAGSLPARCAWVELLAEVIKWPITFGVNHWNTLHGQKWSENFFFKKSSEQVYNFVHMIYFMLQIMLRLK